jgi:sugar-specific transcriptional regulator TrmB
MAMEAENLQILKDLGLSNSQSRVYIALLKLGPESKATSTSKFSKVPRQDIYRVLEELVQIGLVEKLISRPAKYCAISPEKAISNLLEKKKHAFLKLEKDADSLSAKLRENLGNSLQPSKKETFTLITERESVFCKVLELIGASRKKISIVVPWSETKLSLNLALEALTDACNRGVDVNWLSNEPKGTHQIPEGLRKLIKNPKFKFRIGFSDPPIIKLGIYDTNETRIAVFHDDSSKLSPTLISDNSAILAMAENYFENYWKNGKDIEVNTDFNNF